MTHVIHLFFFSWLMAVIHLSVFLSRKTLTQLFESKCSKTPCGRSWNEVRVESKSISEKPQRK